MHNTLLNHVNEGMHNCVCTVQISNIAQMNDQFNTTVTRIFKIFIKLNIFIYSFAAQANNVY